MYYFSNQKKYFLREQYNERGRYRREERLEGNLGYVQDSTQAVSRTWEILRG